MGRLAPSPTGALHLGNARSFLLTWARAKAKEGNLLLRVEDLHMARVKPGALEQIFEDLEWLNIDWNLGPKSSIEAKTDQRYVQSNRKEFYSKGLDQLRELGRIYPCSCTRKELLSFQSAPHLGEELHYPNRCREKEPHVVFEEAKAKGKPVSWRFVVEDLETTFQDHLRGISTSNVMEWSGDFIIARGKDEIGYQLAVVLDDLDHDVTEIVRGDDLLMSSHRQIQIHRALQREHPEYLHLPLLIGNDGQRLAKRHGDWKISTLRRLGHTKERIIGLIAWTLDWASYSAEMTSKDFYQLYLSRPIPHKPFAITEACASDMGV